MDFCLVLIAVDKHKSFVAGVGEPFLERVQDAPTVTQCDYVNGHEMNQRSL
jgi:hypothetical protein